MIKSKQVEHATGPVLLNTEKDYDNNTGRSVAVLNQGAGEVRLVGTVDADETEGWPLAPDERITLDLRDSDKLYAIGTDINLLVFQVGI